MVWWWIKKVFHLKQSTTNTKLVYFYEKILLVWLRFFKLSLQQKQQLCVESCCWWVNQDEPKTTSWFDSWVIECTFHMSNDVHTQKEFFFGILLLFLLTLEDTRVGCKHHHQNTPSPYCFQTRLKKSFPNVAFSNALAWRCMTYQNAIKRPLLVTYHAVFI